MNEHLTQRIIDALRDALDCMAAKVNSPMVREDCYNVIAKIKESISEQLLQPADVVLAALRPMELSPWTAEHCKSYPRKASEIINAALGFKTIIAQQVQPPQNHVWLVANKVVAMYFWSEDRAKKAASGSITLGMDVLRINLLDASPVQPASEKREHEPKIDLDRYAGTYGGTKDK